MRKIAILLIAILVVSVGLLAGCTENKNDNSNEFVDEDVKEPTPNITFITDDIDSYLQVINSDPGNLAWTNINITYDGPDGYSDLTFGSSTGTAYSGSTAPVGWGDITGGQKITVGSTECNVTVLWIPTNTLIGEYSFT